MSYCQYSLPGVLNILLLLSCSDVTLSQTKDDVKSLMTKIFTTDSYNYRVRPATNQSAETKVQLDYILNGIIEFNEQEESLTTSGYLDIFWKDEYLVWTPSSYGGVNLLFIPQDDIWKPDVALQNSFSSFSGLGSKFTSAKVTYDGFVYWNPFQILKSTCSVDIKYFPFDTQTCSLKFIAWSYTKAEVYVEPGSKGIVLDEYQSNSGWDLVATSYTVEHESEESAVLFTMKLKRKPLFFILNIVIPVIFLSLLNVCVFILPVSSGERAGFSITVFLSLAVFLTIVSSTLPQNSEITSYMSMYLMIMIGVSTSIVIVTLIELRLCGRDEKDEPVPYVIVKLHVLCNTLRCKRNRGEKELYKGRGLSAKPSNVVAVCSEPEGPLAANEKSKPSANGNVMAEPWSLDKGAHDKERNENTTCSWTEAVNALDFIFFTFFSLFVAISTAGIYGIAATGQ